MPSIFLGRNKLNWCEKCNLPIIDSKICPNCHENTFLVKISPPYDCRPAFKSDIEKIKRLISSQFGEGCEKIVENEKIIVLNKVGYQDRMDEVVIDGQVIGNIRYNILKENEKWEFIPKHEGARRIINYNPKTWIKVDDDAINPISTGANLFAPGIIDYSSEIKKGDVTFILTKQGDLIAEGFSRFSSDEIAKQKTGMIVKIKYYGSFNTPNIFKKGQDWEMAVKANEQILDRKEVKIINFIKKVCNKYNLPNLVSFSGGKDSLVILLLILKSGIDFKLSFIDTGIEFKETVDFVQYIVKKFNLEEKFLKYESKNDFYVEARENFGPPARDFRWCCKVLKLSSINDLIRDNFPNGTLTFVGNRQYESFLRRNDSRKGKISKNTFIPQQINVNLIDDWIALTVWLYIFREQKQQGFEMNPLYMLGYERVGCIPCPANKLADIEILKERFPKEYEKLFELLKYYAVINNYPEDWITYGLWRWKKYPKGQLDMFEKLQIKPFKINFGSAEEKKLKLSYTVGVSPCLDGSVLLEGKFNSGMDLVRLSIFLSIYGQPLLDLSYGILNIRKDLKLINIFADGSINIRIYEAEESELVNTLNDILPFILKAQKCIGCGICIEMCPMKAIYMEDKRAMINREVCNACLNCLKKCPILEYSYRDILRK